MKKTAIVLGIVIILLAVVFFMFKSNTDNKTDPRGYIYAGANACAKCHQNIYNSYINTAHFLASNSANKFTMHGNFF